MVLLVWYPSPLFTLQDGLGVLVLLVIVDLIVGPALTLFLASAKKPRRELIRDLAIIGVLQLSALAVGGHALFIARPAFVVFNADRFDTVGANQLVRDTALSYRDARFESTPIFGPEWAAARSPDNLQDRNRLLLAAAQGGADIKHYPALYEAWPPPQGIKVSKLKPLAELMKLSQEGGQAGLHAMQRSRLTEIELSYLPLVGTGKIGVVIVNTKTLEIIHASGAEPNY